MYTKFATIILIVVIGLYLFPFTFALQAADEQMSTSIGQDENPGRERTESNRHDGIMTQQTFINSDCGLVQRTSCLRHPTTLSYHPAVYNYRHFYNIVGHDTYLNSLNYRRQTPGMAPPEEILTPVPEQEKYSPQAIPSARLSQARQKNLRQ